MGGDRRNYVMSAEVAMAREMAYRNKLARLGPEGKTPLHAQVPTHTLSQVSWTIQGPPSNSGLPSTYGLVPNQRPGIPGLMPLARPPAFPYANSSPSRIWSPVNPADQSSKPTPTWRPSHSTDQKRKVPIHCDQPRQLGNNFCLVCQIDCMTSFNLMMHYQGQRHRNKLGEPKVKKVAGRSGLSTANERLYCKLCSIWCKDIFTFRLHLQCKNHREHEKKMKIPV